MITDSTVSRPKLTIKQEKFCLAYVELGNGTKAAELAGYSKRTAQAISTENLKKPLVAARIAELRKITEDASIMNIIERKQRLSEIARANITEFMNVDGDQSWVNLSDGEHKGAIQEIKSSTEHRGDGEHGFTVLTSVKLHDPIKAIEVLNKMEKVYGDGPTVNIDNRTINILELTDADIIERLNRTNPPT